ncbi:UNVERIFIED_CONTAM: GEM-like protein 4 [Sesamum calycinum]|uniref:GEM-like protein 4 n=1 Tax=Sesamum calycinum TaxID=2727403 RepID=A0AAW2QY41_9LAMI
MGQNQRVNFSSERTWETTWDTQFRHVKKPLHVKMKFEDEDDGHKGKKDIAYTQPDPAAQYQLLPSPNSNHCSKIRHSRVDSVIAKMIKLGESMDGFAQGIREHVKLGPKLSETVKGKLRLGARILQFGGVEKVFRQKFNIRDDESC